MGTLVLGRRLRRLLGLGALTIATLVLAACVEISMESEFDADGSAVHSISTTVERAFLEDEFFEDEADLDFDEIEREAEEAGLDVERIETTERVGVRISMESDDNEDLGASLNELFNAMNGNGVELNAFSGSFTESGGGLGATTYEFELTVDGTALFDEGEDEFDDEFDFGMDMMRQFFNLTYTVSMPGEIVEHNGNEIGAGMVQWDIPFQGTETFQARSEEGSDFSLMLIAGVAVGGLAIILVVIGGILLMRGRSGPAPAESTADASSETSAAPAAEADPTTATESGETSEPETRDPNRG